MAGLSRVSGWTRIALGLGLLALVLRGSGADEAPDGIRLDESTSEIDVARALVERPGASVSYASALPPTREVSALLESAAESGSDVVLSIPGSLPALEARPPLDLVAMRRASLDVTVRAGRDDVIPLVVRDAAGAADTFQVRVDDSGSRTVSVAVEPTRAGASEWTIKALDDSVTVRAWARPERPVRVLIVSGPPSWESRYLTRALEAAGAEVVVHQSLGRSMTVRTDGAAAPLTSGAIDDYDVIIAMGPLDETVLPPSAETAIGRWVSERGGGLLLAGSGATRGQLGMWAATERGDPIGARTLQWSGPTEVLPLPAADLDIQPFTHTARHPGVRVAWSPQAGGEDRVHVIAGWVGRGRILSSGLDTWPWAMEAGLVQEHVDWWESVVEWLAGGLRADARLVGPVGAPQLLWRGDLRAADSDASTPVSAVPQSAGGLALGPDREVGVVVAPAADRPSWVVAALAIGGAGGAIRTSAEAPDLPGSTIPGPSRAPLLAFLGLALFALTGWATRRLAGEP